MSSSGLSDYLRNAALNWIKGSAMPTAPTTVYIGLFSVAPTDAGGGTEVTTTIRAGGRVAATFGTVASGSMSNSAIVNFGTAAGGASLAAFGIFDAASAGNLLGWGVLTTPQTASTGNSVSFAAGALVTSITDTP